MNREMAAFDCAAVRLDRGVSLVEASAGTGKTYAIAMLVLRLVVEEGIPLERLLVVTFTKAATAELRERIRKRLLEARDLLRGQADDADLTLASWVAGIGDRGPALERLGLALGDIDRAAVFTIHGFCQRMLQEQALESSQLFQVELVPDTAGTRQQVVHDFWRRSMYGLGDLACAVLLRDFATPAALDATIGPISGTIAGIEPVGPGLSEATARLEGIHEGLRAWWLLHRGELATRFAAAIADGYFVAELATGFPLWWRQLEALFDRGRPTAIPDMRWLGRPGLATMLNGQRLRGDDRKQAFLREWPLADEQAADWQDAAAELRLALRASLAAELRTEVERRVREQGAMSYNDLILRLASALNGPAGKRLRTVLGDRYDAALIDEFQDPDAAQWHIFSTLFGGGSHALYLIGDPKQAIYRFRGADIHSYFAARKRADRLLTLDRNFRSHPQLVAAVNELFAGLRPFAVDEAIMPYHPVMAAKTAADGALCQGETVLAPMRYCHLPAPAEGTGRWSSGRAMARIEEYVVGEIGALLRSEPATLIRTEAGARPLAPGDIAILVRSHRQAASYQKALLRRGIPAVIASRLSIFATAECDDLLRLLQALDEPGDLRLLKAAMTSPWFGLDGPQLQAIWQDEEAFDRWRLQFQVYHQLWRDRGLLPMLSTLLREEEVFVRLAAQPAAERRIANIAHLLEVLQEKAAVASLGPYQTLQWLQTMRAGGEGGEEFELRLESDAEAVQVGTMHGAKGLEYPVVFCPCLWYRRNLTSTETELVLFHDRDGRLCADLGSDHFLRRRREAEAEELSEDLRLLYVAVTRARLHCSVVWADVKSYGQIEDSFRSGLGLRLFPAGQVGEEEQIARLRALAADQGVAYQLIGAEGAEAEAPTIARPGPPLVCRLPSGRSLETCRQMTSYSALANQGGGEEGRATEGQGGPVAAGAGGADLIEAPGLPAGARFGNAVHDLLQHLPFANLAAAGDLAERVEAAGRRYGLAVDPDRLAQLLRHTVSARLHADPSTGAAFALAELDPRKLVPEMPFYFHLHRATTPEINRIVAADPAVLPLSFREMQGYLTGFVDLVCEHGGRVYIVDYKTNNLGERQGDYHPDRLTQAMRQHNYGLQYWIYSLVLHRHLRTFVPGYDYGRHFGGVLYLFVRGMSCERPGAGVYHARPDAARLQALHVLLGGSQ